MSYIADLSHSPMPEAPGRKGKIGVVMNTYNAEKYLPQVLDSIREFDDFVVVDMFSTDRTVELAQKAGARVFSFKRCNFCEPARNAAIRASDCEWVLVLDSDEVVPPDLYRFLRKMVEKPDAPDALRLAIRQFFMGREMHCLYPNFILRFARRDKIDWPEKIHCQPHIDGVTKTLPASRKELALIHLEENTLESRMEKIERYTTQELQRRGPKKYSIFEKGLKPAARFFRSYILKGGFRDGSPGFQWARLEALYKQKTIQKQEEAYRKNKSNKQKQ